MINDGRSSLQKAAAKSGGTSSLRNARSSSSKRGSNGNRGTVTSFEVSAPIRPAARPAVAASRDTKTKTAFIISNPTVKNRSKKDLGDSKYTVSQAATATVATTSAATSAAAAAATARRNSKSKKTCKSKQHFTILSAHDEQKQQQQHENGDPAMDVDNHHEINQSSSHSHSSSMQVENIMPVENRQSSTRPATKTQTQTSSQITIDYKMEKNPSSSKSLSPARSISRMVSSKSKKKGLSSTEDLLDITFEAPPSPGVEAAPEPVATPVVEKEVHPVEETQEEEAKSEPIVVAAEKEKLDKEIAYETDNDKVDSSNDCCTACSIM